MRLRRSLVMDSSKPDEDTFHNQLGPPPSPPHLEQFLDPQTQQSINDDDDDFSLTEIDLFGGGDTSPDAEIPLPPPDNPNSPNLPLPNRKNTLIRRPIRISTDPYITTQYYTFNKGSHALMTQCLIETRQPTADEIKAVTPPSVLAGWRSVWKDRSEDTAYMTAWKRIQDRLAIHKPESSAVAGDGNSGNRFICFKNNTNLLISHVDEWQDIVLSFHSNTNGKHLAVKDTTERIRQVWAVGKKFYGIPEGYIRTCVITCPACSDLSSGCAPRLKRRRFEYTESLDVPATEVQVRLQQLAVKHKVVLCIRQKYIRYKPFMAEVKDYACHRAGEPASSKKSKLLKRDPYTSKRCGCEFRIRAIVPISNYCEKEKTFVYDEEGTAEFKLYTVHSGHKPGASDGNARIIHKLVGHKGGLLLDYDTLYGIAEEGDDGFGLFEKDPQELQRLVPQQLQDLRNEIGLLEGRIGKLPPQILNSVSRELFEITNKIRNVADDGDGSFSGKQHLDDVLVVEHDLPDWGDDQHTRIYGDGKDVDVNEDDDEDSFGRTLGEVATWDQMRMEGSNQKDIILGEACKDEKWMKCGGFDEKGFLGSSNGKADKHLRHDEVIDPDVGLAGIQVDSFYPENQKWLDSPCELDPGVDSGDVDFRHVV